jgi:hypothetical protein
LVKSSMLHSGASGSAASAAPSSAAAVAGTGAATSAWGASAFFDHGFELLRVYALHEV